MCSSDLFWCHRTDDYLGGSLVTAAITALNYEIFGLRLFALKLTALLFALGGLLFTYRFAERELGARAADLFALLYTFAPPAFLFLGAVSMGYHTESVLFLGAMLLLGSRIERVPRAIDFALLGLLGGFAFWYDNLNGIAILATLAAIGGTRQAAPSRRDGLFLAGLGLGLSPWFAQNLGTGF